MTMFSLLQKDGNLFAIDNKTNNFAGMIINNAYGTCTENPEEDHNFRRLYEGHGNIYEMGDHLFGVKNWNDIFSNPNLLPNETKQVFLDCGSNAFSSFKAKYSN